MSNRFRQQRRAKRFEPRFKRRTPLIGRSCDKISLDMHLALARLFSMPTTDARDDLADTLNVISICIQGDQRFVEEQTVLEQAAAALHPYRAPAPLGDEARHALAQMASVIDTILGFLDRETLCAAEVAYVKAARSLRVAAGSNGNAAT